jgi:hypothetical protein
VVPRNIDVVGMVAEALASGAEPELIERAVQRQDPGRNRGISGREGRRRQVRNRKTTSEDRREEGRKLSFSSS